jgi:glycosyltransferase involved in cell wall biosynthesis
MIMTARRNGVKLVVQIPALNEEKTLADVIRGIPRSIPGISSTEVVVVDDGSSDRTSEIAEQNGAVVVRHEKTRGVGAAFRSGVEQSAELGADIIVTIDADGQFDTLDIPKLVEPIVRGQADFVAASRFIDKSMAPEMPWLKRWGNDFMARWISRLVGHRFHDVSCGFRAYSRNAYLRLILLGDFTYTHETFLSLAFSRIPIREVPVKVRGTREHGDSRVASNLFRYGWRTAAIILKTFRDYKPMRFFGGLAGILLTLAICFGAFLMSVKLRTGGFTPHKWSGFVAAAFAGSALLVYLIGLVAEMLDRMRVGQDELVYRVRRLEAALKDKGS